MSPTFSRASSVLTTVAGGAAVSRNRNTKSTFPVTWKIRGPADIDLLMSFFDGGQGGGPYCLVDPSQTNWLPPNVARMGAVLSSLPEWAPATGALAVSSQAGPTGLYSGVAGWTGGGNGSILYQGLNNVIDGTWLPPIVTGLSHRFAIYAKMLSGSASLTAAVLQGVGGVAPTGTATATAATVALSSTWQEVSATVANNFAWTATNDYCGLRLTISSSSSPSILLAAPSMVYDTASTAPALSPWASGIGVPRVVIVGDAPSAVGRPGFRDYTLTLQEA